MPWAVTECGRRGATGGGGEGFIVLVWATEVLVCRRGSRRPMPIPASISSRPRGLPVSAASARVDPELRAGGIGCAVEADADATLRAIGEADPQRRETAAIGFLHVRQFELKAVVKLSLGFLVRVKPDRDAIASPVGGKIAQKGVHRLIGAAAVGLEDDRAFRRLIGCAYGALQLAEKRRRILNVSANRRSERPSLVEIRRIRNTVAEHERRRRQQRVIDRSFRIERADLAKQLACQNAAAKRDQQHGRKIVARVEREIGTVKPQLDLVACDEQGLGTQRPPGAGTA